MVRPASAGYGLASVCRCVRRLREGESPFAAALVAVVIPVRRAPSHPLSPPRSVRISDVGVMKRQTTTANLPIVERNVVVLDKYGVRLGTRAPGERTTTRLLGQTIRRPDHTTVERQVHYLIYLDHVVDAWVPQCRGATLVAILSF